MMDKQYVEYRDDSYWIAGTRVSLKSIVLAFQDGLSPETIAAECFPTLTLEEVYGAVAYYLGHQAEIDQFLRDSAIEEEKIVSEIQAKEPEFYRKLMLARRALAVTHT
jgi:uncharacterized protein (DUF433 family)